MWKFRRFRILLIIKCCSRKNPWQHFLSKKKTKDENLSKDLWF